MRKYNRAVSPCLRNLTLDYIDRVIVFFTFCLFHLHTCSICTESENIKLNAVYGNGIAIFPRYLHAKDKYLSFAALTSRLGQS